MTWPEGGQIFGKPLNGNKIDKHSNSDSTPVPSGQADLLPDTPYSTVSTQASGNWCVCNDLTRFRSARAASKSPSDLKMYT